MPQHDLEKGGKLPQHQQGRSSATAGESAEPSQAAGWQRGQGGFSGKAKKEYLKWKRQQKEAAAGPDSQGTDSDAVPSQPAGRREAGKQAAAPDSSADDPTLPLQYRPLVTVPAAPFIAAAAGPAASPAATAHGGSTAGSPASCSTIECVQLQDTRTGQHAAAAVEPASEPELVYMPRLDPSEVGFTAEGFELDMPVRPAWQGVVSSAEELHALEEQQFTEWQAKLLEKAAVSAGSTATAASTTGSSGAAVTTDAARQGGVGRLSFYEGRLEFWRQLWRTLEMSDIVLMIVDARNPVLHFSHALYRHITRDHKLPLVLLLNKCDLIPAAAAAAWQAWLQQQLPGVTVVPVSAAAGQAEAAARQVLGAVLQQRVERGGQQVLVQEFVGKTVDELIAESVQRNMHAKRHIVQPQHPHAAVADAVTNSEHANSAAVAGTGDEGQEVAGAAGVESDDEDDDWSLRPCKRAGARKGGRKGTRGRQQQQQDQQGASSQLRAGKGNTRAAAAAAAGGGGLGKRGASLTSTHSVVTHAAVRDSHMSERDAESDDGLDSESVDESGRDEELTTMNDMLEELTLERRLSSTTSRASSNLAPSAAAVAAAGASAAANAGAAGAAVGSNVATWEFDSRPVVIGLLGEPNVGKSSTLNALLGTHRVAVSCHPGRTKHYQTHFMSNRMVLCDCPGIVFPRLDVSLPMQVLFGSYPIASCREPYAVLRYLASASCPRIHTKLGLRQPGHQPEQQQQQLDEPGQLERQQHAAAHSSNNGGGGDVEIADAVQPAAAGRQADAYEDASWSPWALCEALCQKRRWVLPRSGRLDTYRAANWMLRAALGGQQGLGLAFMPPA